MKNKISILVSLLFSGGLIMLAMFLSTSLSPSIAKADGNGETCYTESEYYEGICVCKRYNCVEVGLSTISTRNGLGCFKGNSTTSVYGWDTSIDQGDPWGDTSSCFIVE